MLPAHTLLIVKATKHQGQLVHSTPELWVEQKTPEETLVQVLFKEGTEGSKTHSFIVVIA